MNHSITAGGIRRVILEWPTDDCDLFRVFSVPDENSTNPAEDITERFALEWAMEIQFAEGIEPHDYLAPFPAFVRANCEERLTTIWQRRMAEADRNYLPDPVRQVA